jgi:hypothetical protein
MLAKFTGKVASIQLAVPLARFRSRSLHEDVGSPADWNLWTSLSRASRTDLKWWEHLNVNASERDIWEPVTQKELHCDASGEIGWGAVLQNTVPAQGFWREHQKSRHITFKELMAVRFAVECFAPELAKTVVRLHEDNQAVCAILMKGTSKSPELMRELRKLFHLCGLHSITLRPQYIKSQLNIAADRLSRMTDSEDWMLNPKYFDIATDTWGLPSVDRFATANNHQVPRFNSRYRSPGMEAMDCWSQDWSLEHNWLNPPWTCIGRCLDKLRRQGGTATMVVPYWTSQYWWPMLTDMAVDSMYLPPQQDLFLPGDRGSSVVVGRPHWGVLLVLIQCLPST